MKSELLTPDKIIGYCLIFLTLGYLFIIVIIKHKPLWNAIVGEDKKLQIAEIITLIGLILFPIVILADVFLGFIASTHAMYSVDFIIATGLTGKGYKDYLDNKNQKDEK